MQRERDYGIDVLRGIALILIFIYHYYQFQGSYVGVIIFFALSGYLVTEGLLAENFDYWLYLKKKFIKLYPLLLLVVFVCTLGVFFLEKLIFWQKNNKKRILTLWKWWKIRKIGFLVFKKNDNFGLYE